ncbi:MAG: ribonuclease [Apibacter sp.]|nr:ribonuclease [Apibacter sp.]
MKIKKQSLFYSLFFGVLLIISLILSYNLSNKKLNLEQFNIEQLSSEDIVINYIKKNHSLPNYYIKKMEARKAGWRPEKGNLCRILPGKIIGGDIFKNIENKIPSKKGRKWIEADLNYKCGMRGPDRVIFSNDGLIFVTYDHYNTFQQR